MRRREEEKKNVRQKIKIKKVNNKRTKINVLRPSKMGVMISMSPE
jgi:hypothetical protein